MTHTRSNLMLDSNMSASIQSFVLWSCTYSYSPMPYVYVWIHTMIRTTIARKTLEFPWEIYTNSSEPFPKSHHTKRCINMHQGLSHPRPPSSPLLLPCLCHSAIPLLRRPLCAKALLLQHFTFSLLHIQWHEFSFMIAWRILHHSFSLFSVLPLHTQSFGTVEQQQHWQHTTKTLPCPHYLVSLCMTMSR